ncbi:MAG: class I SAM-dependent methyltransferase [Verrucomicrobia bacterium]|nr:class I SAM-dependent methyltransferase [Verrucomicrobiota bacterium]
MLDISTSALDQARQRLGDRARQVAWFEADITEFTPPHRFGLWHDRAVFHFLTDSSDRRKYVQTLERTVVCGGHVIISTFAIDGPRQCSGLQVMRFDAASIGTELGGGFDLVEQVDETHVTPWNTEQQFSYFRFAVKPMAQGHDRSFFLGRIFCHTIETTGRLRLRKDHREQQRPGTGRCRIGRSTGALPSRRLRQGLELLRTRSSRSGRSVADRLERR